MLWWKMPVELAVFPGDQVVPTATFFDKFSKFTTVGVKRLHDSLICKLECKFCNENNNYVTKFTKIS